MAVTKSCTGTDKVSAYDASTGAFTCTADQTGAGGGITSLNGATVATQTLVDGANIHVSTNTGTGAHTIAVTGLGDAAAKNTGTTAGTVAAGDDSRFTNARTPTAHAPRTRTGDRRDRGYDGRRQRDPESGLRRQTRCWLDSGPERDLSAAALDGRPGLGPLGTIHRLDCGLGGASIKNKPTLGTAAAKDIPASGDASATQVVYGSDTRLTNARTPSAHAASHQNGGSDEIATATAAANAIPKAGAGGQLAAGWMPALSGDVTTSAGAVATTLRSGLTVRQCEIHINGTGTAGVVQSTDGDFVNCVNKRGVTWTITSLTCFSDNAGATTVQIANDTPTNVLSSAVTCSQTGAAGTLNGTPTVATGHWLTAPTISPDAATKTLVILITGTI